MTGLELRANLPNPARVDDASAHDDGCGRSDHERRIAAASLFRGEREIVIVYQNQEYRLRITRAGKLILTK
jgi:hemin uptake protein HemP